MKKKFEGTTLIYDATEETYLRTEVYMSDDPSATVELRIIEDAHPKFSDHQIDDSSGPWKHIISPVVEASDQRDEPVLLLESQRKSLPQRRRTATKVLAPRSHGATQSPHQTLHGLPTIGPDDTFH